MRGKTLHFAFPLDLSLLLALALLLSIWSSAHAQSGVQPSPGTGADSGGAGDSSSVHSTDPDTVETLTGTLSLPDSHTPVVSPSNPITSTPSLTATIDENLPPEAPILNAPADGAVGVSLAPTLDVSVADPDQDHLTVTFYGRQVLTSVAPDFTLIALPDTQYYSCGWLCGSDPGIYVSQIQWIVDNQLESNITFVAHEGDVVEFGDVLESHWQNADAAMSLLETPILPGLPDGIPYGIAVGNHDQYFGTMFYNQYFGIDRFQDRAYYGGHYGTTNNDNFAFFSVGNLDFIVVFLEYDTGADPDVLAWADNLLKTYPERRAIVVSHFIIWPGDPGAFGPQGQAIYTALKGNPNLFLMLCGHEAGEGKRQDSFQGTAVHTLLADYQDRANGGDGWLRILQFSPANDEIQVRTYSPTLDQFEMDGDSEFRLSYTMQRSVFQIIAINYGVVSGSDTEAVWDNLFPATEYEWYVAVSDGTATTIGPIWEFTTVGEDRALLSIGDAAVVEGDSGPSFAQFSVTLSITSTEAITVEYATADGSATAPEDYTAIPSTTLVFTPGHTTRAVTVSIQGDTLDEPDEGFSVNLASPVNASLGDSRGQGTIQDDDLPTVEFGLESYTVTETVGGVAITVTLDMPSWQTVTVDYATADGTAMAGQDYDTIDGTLTFSSGVQSRSFLLNIADDDLAEGDETAQIALSDAVNAVIGANSPITLTIVDDDLASTIYLPLVVRQP